MNLGEFGLYAVLAVMAGIVGIAFTRTLYGFEDFFDGINIPEYVKPVPGGLCLGLIGLFLPQIFGVGYPAMSQALNGEFGLRFLVILLAAKIVAVSLTIGSGGSGGVFAPSLFIGAMLGTAFGTAANAVFPGFVAPPGAYGLVGMAAVFTGAARAPITAVIILFELTGDYRIILPLMLAVVLSTLVSEALSRDTIYTLKLRRRGIDLRAGRDVDLMRAVPVAQAMSAHVPIASAETSVSEAAEQLDDSGDRALLVLDSTGAPRAIATIHDLGVALLGNGVLRRTDIVRAYSHAMLDRLESQTRRPVVPRDLRGTRIVEVPIDSGSILAGKSVRALELPADILVVAVERDSETVIPRGDTQLRVGDCLQVLVRDDAIVGLHEHLASLRVAATSS